MRVLLYNEAMNTTHLNPAPAAGQTVRFDRPAGWGKGTVVAVRPQRQIKGHDGRSVVWGDSDTHVDVEIEWVDGHESFGTAPGERSTISVGHSFAGSRVDTTNNGWPAGWTATEPAEAVAR